MKKSTDAPKLQLSLNIKLGSSSVSQKSAETCRTVGFNDSVSLEIRREATQRVEKSGIFALPKANKKR